MERLLVSVSRWVAPQLYDGEQKFSAGDIVIAESGQGSFLGRVVGEGGSESESSAGTVRKATNSEMEAAKRNEDRSQEIINWSRAEAKRTGVEMKTIEALITLDGSSVAVYFTADGRVDFRDLVKSISRQFHRSIRMQQIGSREEARRIGGCGVCGKELCCVRFPGNLPSISTDMARVQQIAHRGTERISGLCGRLMCCLAYEAQQYRDLLVGMPELFSTIETRQGRGQVIELNPLRQELRIRLENNHIVNVKRSELK